MDQEQEDQQRSKDADNLRAHADAGRLGFRNRERVLHDQEAVDERRHQEEQHGDFPAQVLNCRVVSGEAKGK